MLSYFFWGLLLLAAPRSPVLVVLAFLANMSASVFMGCVVVLGALPRGVSNRATLALLNSSLRVYLALEPLSHSVSESGAAYCARRLRSGAAVRMQAVFASAARAGEGVSHVGASYVGAPLAAAGSWWVKRSAAAAVALSEWFDRRRALRGDARVAPNDGEAGRGDEKRGDGEAGEATAASRGADRASPVADDDERGSRSERRRRRRREREERGEGGDSKRSGSALHFLPFPIS